ncbi:rubredoxin [Niabella sp. CC-SYL272]|uniref:rubredoxin n=1 Tax=Niabella agricola TaxID=2891571 RepID=UPI001F1DA3E6|nr:rubredoxin [Niabella agricola]MCF3109721.1 rubredoxin [Niabella agricola]
MSERITIKINFPGGIISPGVLHEILAQLENNGTDQVRFGLRQQLLISGRADALHPLKAYLETTKLVYETGQDAFPNMVTSYPAEEIFINHTWLSEGVYKDILDAVDYTPKVKINISDSNQSFTPLLTGNINWVAAVDTPHFWHLFIRFPKTNIIYEWDQMVYTNDIAQCSRAIESLIWTHPHLFYDQPDADGRLLFRLLGNNAYITKPAAQPALLPDFNLPYYEGLHRYNNKYWLGVYRRDELFSTAFLKDLCRICLQTKIGQLCATPWKSIIVKGITEKDKPLWNALLNTHTINMRHAANELNFQVEDNSSPATRLKQYLVKKLNTHDTRTFGLCIGIKTRKKSEIFSSILVKRKPFFQLGNKALFYVYDILCAHAYNPNKRTGFIAGSNLPKFMLVKYLNRSLKDFYTRMADPNQLPAESASLPVPEIAAPEDTCVHQCPHCLTIYDPCIGEPEHCIPSGTAFAELPSAYTCPLCDTGKDQFIKIEKTSLGLQTV